MPSKATTYDVNPYLIGELFTGSHNFRVPEFQRSYVWSSSPNPKQERQVNLFFEDILGSSENNENYYFQINHNEKLVTIFFDKENYDIKGWTTKDIYHNEVETLLFNIETNIMIDESIFKLQRYIN